VGGQTTDVGNARLLRRQTYGYLPNCRVSPPVDRYQIILLGDGDTHKGVNNLHRVVTQPRTHDLEWNPPPLHRESDAQPVEPLRHHDENVNGRKASDSSTRAQSLRALLIFIY